MHTLSLGPHGPTVPAFCLGTMTWSNQTPLSDAHRQMAMALDHGLTFLDTAEMYPVNPVSAATIGGTEKVIGQWLAAHGGRDALVIATKVTGLGSEVIEGGAPPITPARLRSAVEASLTRLGTDRIDVYQLHWPNRGSYHFRKNWTYRPPTAPRAELVADMRATVETMGALIAEGKILHWGLSNESTWGMARWISLAEEMGVARPVSVQNEYSLLCRMFDTDMAELCTVEEVPLLAFSPLAAGLLTGKYAGDVVPEGSRRQFRPDLGGRITAPRVFEAVAAYLGLAREAGLNPVQMALAWCRSRPFPIIPIIGATTSAQLAEQLPALEMTLAPDVLAAIEAINKQQPMPF